MGQKTHDRTENPLVWSEETCVLGMWIRNRVILRGGRAVIYMKRGKNREKEEREKNNCKKKDQDIKLNDK